MFCGLDRKILMRLQRNIAPEERRTQASGAVKSPVGHRADRERAGRLQAFPSDSSISCRWLPAPDPR